MLYSINFYETVLYVFFVEDLSVKPVCEQRSSLPAVSSYLLLPSSGGRWGCLPDLFFMFHVLENLHHEVSYAEVA